MKTLAELPKKKRQKFTTREYSLSNAKAFLGRLLDKATQGEEVIISRGSERFSLHYVPMIEPILHRPHGYFQFDDEDLALDKKLAKANVRPKPQDFE